MFLQRNVDYCHHSHRLSPILPPPLSLSHTHTHTIVCLHRSVCKEQMLLTCMGKSNRLRERAGSRTKRDAREISLRCQSTLPPTGVNSDLG